MTFSTSAPISHVIDASLGLGPLPIENVSITSERFGIILEESAFQGGQITFEQAAVVDCSVRAESRKAKEWVSIRAQMIFPPFNPSTTPEWKCRIKSTCFEATLNLNKCNIEYVFDPQVAYELGDLVDSLNFLHIASQEDCKLTFMRAGRRLATSVSRKADVTLGEGMVAVRARAKMVRRFLDRVEYRSTVRLRPCQLFEQEANMKWMIAATSSGRSHVEVEFEGDFVLPARKGIFANPVCLEVDGETIVAFCYWKARFIAEGIKLRADIRDLEVWECMPIKPDEEQSLPELNRSFQAFCRDLSPKLVLARDVESSVQDSLKSP